MHKWIRYIDEEGKKKLRKSDEWLKEEVEKKEIKEKEKIKMVKRRNEYINSFINLNPDCDEKLIRRFFSKVDVRGEDECWNWLFSVTWDGYGWMKVYGKITKVHRLSYVIHYGEIPKDKPLITHSCNNRLCVNPNHLKSDTHRGNMNYMVVQNRHPKGERCGMSILTQKDVDEIREFYKEEKYSYNELSKMFDISYDEIWFIIKNKRWYSDDYQKYLDGKNKNG